jgi:geranylgeranyl diphosphate synthase, type I
MDNVVQPPINPFAAQQHLLRERLNFLLATVHPALYDDVVRAFREEGKLLCQTPTDVHSPRASSPAGIWSLLTLLVAQYIAPDIDPIYASSVAIAVECFASALDLLDDVEDDDQTPIVQELGAARVLNVTTVLLTMAQQALLSLSELGIDPARILRLLKTLQESALGITSGQHRDLLAEQRSALEFTSEECIDIAAAKAGAILQLACRLGAQCAGADEALCEQFAEFGLLLGIAAQLDNDCHDLYHLLQDVIPTILPGDAGATPGSEKSDLVRGKKTLPIVLAAAEIAKTRGMTAMSLDDALQKISELSDEERNEYLRALKEGMLATWGICLLYLERARDRLQEFESLRPVSPTLRILTGLE